jgi:hypothetical protein
VQSLTRNFSTLIISLFVLRKTPHKKMREYQRTLFVLTETGYIYWNNYMDFMNSLQGVSDDSGFIHQPT